tara:strand:+ start:404 stop:568 length:165 start_codon:yes stop_codon:yes gene_type:complete
MQLSKNIRRSIWNSLYIVIAPESDTGLANIFIYMDKGEGGRVGKDVVTREGILR